MYQTCNIPRNFWHFLSLTQPVSLRYLHGFIAALVFSQVITSNGIAFTADGTPYGPLALAHITTGLTLLILSAILIVYCITLRGLRHYFPYLWGDTAQIRLDVHTLLKRSLPEASPRGLAASVQGPGLGAVALVVLSGAGWFMLWLLDSPLAPALREWHVTLTGLIEVYIVAHGAMGLLHFTLWYFRQRTGTD